MSLLDRDITSRLDRSRYANSLTYFDETDDGQRRFDVEFEIVEDQLVYDLKRPATLRHRVGIGKSRIAGWTVTEGTGPAGCDQIVFTLATVPSTGSLVRVVYDFQGNPAGEYFGRRTPVEVDEESDPQVYLTNGDEKLWHLAGRRDVYNDPSFWWVITDSNPGFNGVFRAMLKPIPADLEIEIPAEGDVLLQIEGIFEL